MEEYSFNEDKLLTELRDYISNTYSEHYATGKIQTLEVIIDDGDGKQFCRGNAFKYLRRYGKKDGYNRKDLLKALHYVLLMLYVHDEEIVKNEN